MITTTSTSGSVLEREALPFNDKDIKVAVDRVTRDNCFSPVVEYLESLTWDGKPRLNLWMEKCLGTPPSPFASLIAPKVLIAAVARAMKPGCKVDTVLVLEGPQGISKSAAIKALFGEEWFIDAVSLFDKHSDMVAVTEGAWVVELAEFVAIANSDNNSVKGLLTIEKDKVRKAYAGRADVFPRRLRLLRHDQSGRRDGLSHRRDGQPAILAGALHQGPPGLDCRLP